MAGYQLKTQKTTANPVEFIETITDKSKKQDSLDLIKLFQKITAKKPAMWGSSIVGFGSYYYETSSKCKGNWPITGFSPRKQNISIYVMLGFSKYSNFLKKIGKYKTGVSCLYIKKLADIDLPVLTELIKQSVADMKKIYKCD